MTSSEAMRPRATVNAAATARNASTSLRCIAR
jgi:hypothetical protein